jgi:hypothetical protein
MMAVTMTRTVIMKIGLSGVKMTISIRYQFMPHLVMNHLEMDKCLYLHKNFYAIF